MSQPDRPFELFISYSHADDELRRALVNHLALLQRQGVITGWHDRLIPAGKEWAGEIDEHLNSADIILLLVSSDFLASDYCYEKEMNRAIERHEAGEAVVIPVIVRACDWQSARFGKFQALPTDGGPVTSRTNQDEAFSEIARGIRGRVERLRSQSRPSSPFFRSLARPSLPYLCDRSEQEDELGPKLHRHLGERPGRSVVCIIHGDEHEDHGGFLDRLQHHSLPNFLDLQSRRMSVRDYTWRPPSRVNHPDVFWPRLGDALLQNASAPSGQILDFIAQHEEPLMIRMELLTEDFQENIEELLTAFFDFCRRWPDLPRGRTVLHCVCLKYQRFDDAGWIKNLKLRRLNRRLRSFVEHFDFSRFPEVSGIVLPELNAIPQGDVVVWSCHNLVREFCRIEDSQIRALYRRKDLCNGDGRIPMEKLVRELRELMSNERKER